VGVEREKAGWGESWRGGMEEGGRVRVIGGRGQEEGGFCGV
jgi:hypothetical protein